MSNIKPKILTTAQARELAWFARNVIGLRTEYYEVLSHVEKFKGKFERLQKTAKMIQDYLGENYPEKSFSFFDQEQPTSAGTEE